MYVKENIVHNVRRNKWVSELETQITFRTLCPMFLETLTVIKEIVNCFKY